MERNGFVAGMTRGSSREQSIATAAPEQIRSGCFLSVNHRDSWCFYRLSLSMNSSVMMDASANTMTKIRMWSQFPSMFSLVYA